MLIAIVMYLVIGGIIIVLCEKELMEVVEDYTLAKKILFFALMIIEAPLAFVWGLVKGIYRQDKK